MRKKRQCNFSSRFVFVGALFLLYALPVASRAQNVTVSVSNGSLDNVFRQLTEQTSMQIVYNTAAARAIRLSNVELSADNASQVLDQVLARTNLYWELSSGIYLIKEREAVVQQALPPITGVVLDAEDRPLAGATVVIMGTTTGVATDVRGRFSLRNPGGSDLRVQISFVGMGAVEVPYEGKELRVTMRDEVFEVGSVVVTGIFDKPRESYTGAVTTISSRQLQDYRGRNLIETLGNIDPSINIMPDNLQGSNPNAAPQITIRGNSTLPVSVEDYDEQYSNEINTPLIVMDGFEISLTKLMDYNDDDIQSINILKDAAATAIYGSRGANGVIVIVSKTPAPGRLRFTAQAQLSMELPDLTTYNLLNARELLALQKQVGIYDGNTLDQHEIMQESYERRLKDVLEGVDTDWLHYPVRTGISQRYNMRIEGGDEQLRWGATLGYNNMQGVMRGSVRDNFTGGVTLLYKYRNVTFRNNLSIGMNKGVESPYGSFATWAAMEPYYRAYDETGAIQRHLPSLYYEDNINGLFQSPLYDAQLDTRNDNRYTEIINNFSIDWAILPELTLRARLGLSRKHSESNYFLPPDHSTFMYHEVNNQYFDRGLYRLGTGGGNNVEGSVTLAYNKVFGEKHSLYAGLDLSIQQSDDYMLWAEAEGYSNDRQNFWGQASHYKTGGIPSGSEGLTRRAGATANVNYTYDNRFYADMSFRFDGSSQFGANNRFAPFWALGVGWSVHNEEWLKDSGVVSALRLRASYGSVGSQQFSPYQALMTYSYGLNGNSDRYLNRQGAQLMALGNEDLKWQTTEEIDFGVELGLFGDRLTARADVYVHNTSDQLSSMNLPWSTGYTSYVDNVGKMRNSGFEVMLGGYPVRDSERRLSWMVNASLMYNKNEIVKLSDAVKAQSELRRQSEEYDINTLFFEGYSQDAIWAVKSLGIDPATGQEVFLDINGIPTTTWSGADKVYCGVQSSPWRGNLTSVLRWRDFTLNLAFGFRWGGQVYNQTLLDKVEVTNQMIGQGNVDRRVLSERWSKPGDVKFFKAYSSTRTRATSRFVMDENVLEFQSASLQYRLDRGRLLERLDLATMTFSINANDLLYLSTVKRERGINYPFARSVGASVQISF